MPKASSFGFSLIFFSIFLLISLSSQQPAALPTSVTAVMASREMRYHHFVWHNIRNLWNTLDSKTQATIRGYGWAPPRPAKDKSGNALTDNNSGEDFLYMHRQMIAKVNSLLAKAGSSKVSGFTSIPAANDKTYPMPPVYTGPTSGLTSLVKYYKGSSYYNYLKSQEKKLKDPAFLKTMTLGQLGSYIEFTSDTHQGLHFRFSEYNKLMRVKTNAVVPYVDKKWDVPSSNWMGDLYSSQANPWFWKVHGWVDDRINDWQKAHGLSKITWKGTWTGGNMANLPSNLDIPANNDARFLVERDLMDMNGKEENCFDHKMNITALEEIARLLVEKGVQCEYYSDLDPEDVPKDAKCKNMNNRLRM